MLKIENIANDKPELQHHEWPPVAKFTKFGQMLGRFLELDEDGRAHMLDQLRADTEAHGQLIHEGLGTIYAYIYGYPDSPCYLKTDTSLETRLLSAKLVLENEMIERWLPVDPIKQIDNQEDAVEYLREFIAANKGVYHPLFDFIRDELNRDGMIEFMRLEVCRNEVVDDEVALLVVGLQGLMKKVMASNLWDECGNGQLVRFHTYWLRRLMNRLEQWQLMPGYRETDKPWSSSITSNSFNALLTRPSYKLRAYGSFLTTEAWVEPHFERILAGLERVGLSDDDVIVYFQSHVKIDPHHTDEILHGIAHQCPRLSPVQVQEIIRGAHIAAAAGFAQYERILHHLRHFTALI